MQFLPTRIAYEVVEDGKLVVYLYGRNADGTRGAYELLDTEPYFFVKNVKGPMTGEDDRRIKRIERSAAKTLDGQSVAKVVCHYPFDVPKLREFYGKTWEADVLYENRIRYDHGIKSVIEVPKKTRLKSSDIKVPAKPKKITPRVAVLDIETYGKGAFTGPKYPTDPVVAITIWDSYDDAYVTIYNGEISEEEKKRAIGFYRKKKWKVRTVVVKSEGDLFKMFRKYLNALRPDIICGWNSSGAPKSFDIPYLQNRARIRGYMIPNWREFAYFDLMWAYDRLLEGEAESLKLDSVAKVVGLTGKSTKKPVWWMYENDPAMLLTYNVNDVNQTKEIMERKGLVEFFLGIAGFAGCGIESSLSSGRLIDAYVFHYLKGSRVQPTKIQGGWGKIVGAMVFEASTGVFKNVIEIDNSGEYAQLIRTLNLSPETKVGPEYKGKVHVTSAGHRYRVEPRGIFPQIIDELIELRAQKKAAGEKEQERVVKEITLSFYGVLASKDYRNGDPEIAQDITRTAQEHLKWNARIVEKMGGQVLYGDTDSTFFILKGYAPDVKAVRKKADKIAATINASLPRFVKQFGSNNCTLSVKVENVYDGFFQAGVKKRYIAIYQDKAGTLSHEGTRYSFKVRGYEIRRSNAAHITKTMQQEAFKRILLGQSKEEVKEYILQVVKDAKRGKIPPEEFGIPMGMHKDTYGKTIPWHAKAAHWSNQHLGKSFRGGDKPRIYHGSIEGKPHTETFALEDDDLVPKTARINWKVTIEKTILAPLQPIFDVVGLYPDEIMNPAKSVTKYF